MAHCNVSPCASLPSWNLICLAGLLSGVVGCGGRDPVHAAANVVESISGGLDTDVLRIASTWPRSEREQVEKEFLDQTSGPVPVRVAWVELPPGPRLDKLGTCVPQADILLGGPLTEYARLSRAGLLEPENGQGEPYWFVARRQQIFLSPEISQRQEQVSLDDPRVDPPTLTWAAGQLRNDSWRDGYARLVLLFSRSLHRPGWQSGSALAAANRGEAAQTLRIGALPGSASVSDRDPSVVTWIEGTAILRGNWHTAQARAFLRFLVDHRGATPGWESPDLDPEVSDLLADFLGATLVDAQEELLVAGATLARAGEPASAQAQAWLTEPPPWPPASIEKLQASGGDSALAMVQDLAGQIAPDPEPRFWLVQSWLRPPRPIDQAMLTELAQAVGGRLAREPRFRAWLRGEWTAWARQRYRRVARLAAGAGSAAGESPLRSPLPRDRS
jgi:hypothetical protein